MTDYIKREDAIKAIESLQSFLIYSEFVGKRGTMYSAYDIGKAIEMIPFADVVSREDYEGLELVCKNYEDALKDAVDELEKVERKRGKWEFANCVPYHDSEGNFIDEEIEEQCSLCGRHVTRYALQLQDSFCPNCGADMRGRKDERTD